MPGTTTPTTTDTEAEFSAAWEGFFRAARRARARHGSDDGLSVPQLNLLEPLLGGPSKMRALACAAGVTAPTATRMLDGLSRQGLVERTPSDEDRRCVLVALTDDGRREVETKRRQVQANRRKVARLLDDTERAQATVLLQRLADAMEDL